MEQETESIQTISNQAWADIVAAGKPPPEPYKHKKASEIFRNLRLSNKRRRLPTLPHCIAVPSAQVGLTSLFGMGRGGTPPQ